MYLRYGSTDEHIPLTEAEIEEEFGKQDMARVFVLRELLTEDDVERGQTRMHVVEDESDAEGDAEFGGVLRDVNRQGSLTELLVESFERYSRDAEPTSGGERWDGVSDDTIVIDAIDNVNEISAGTIEQQETGMTMVFSHSSQCKKIREVETTTTGEVKYQPDQTVDYVSRLGTDRTTTVLSPSNQNITGEFIAEKKGGDEDVTHLRLIGAGEGRHQVTVNLVPESDPYDYEGDDEYDNVERYTASHWEEGDRKEWDVRSNKDHTKPDTLTTLAQSIMEDVQTTHVEAFATIEGIDVNLGDTFTVEYPEEEINDEMRVVQLETQIDSSGYTYNVDLSTRKESLEDPESEDRKDTQRYNMAFEGSPVTINTGGGRQPVDNDASKRYEFDVYYPDEVEYEHRVQLQVKALAYRYYADPQPHAHEVDVSHDHDTQGHSHEFDVSHSHTTNGHSHSFNATHSHDTQGHSHSFDASHSHTTLGHDHSFDATHSHSTWGHSHSISTTSDPVDWDESFQTLNDTGGGGSSPSVTFNLGDGGGNTVFARVNAKGLSTGDTIFGEIEVHDGSGTSSTTIASNTYTADEGSEFMVGCVAGSNDRSSSYVTVSLDGQDDNFNDATFDNDEFTVETIPDHRHNVADTTTEESEVVEEEVVSDTTEEESEVVAEEVISDTTTSESEVVEEHVIDDTTESVAAVVEEELISDTTVESSEVVQERIITESTDSVTAMEAGIQEINEYPSNCDVLINGESVGVSLFDGTGEDEGTVDIRGYLIPGQWNKIEITSETLGHMMAHLDVDCYRQILGDG